MNKIFIVSKSKLFIISVSLIYILAVLLSVRGDYVSGDEQGFLTAFADRGAKGSFDWRYFIWVFYISNLSNFHSSIPLIFNVFLMIFLVKKNINNNNFSFHMALVLVLLPTVFYYFNSYLRDVIFFIFSVSLLAYFKVENNGNKKIIIIFIWLVIFTIRPFYGCIYIATAMLASDRLSRYFEVLIFSLGISFFSIGILILLNDSLYVAYFDFFYYGHLNGRDNLGVLMIPLNEFNNLTAALNFLISPLYFWIIPAEGVGTNFDLILYLENGLFVIMFVLAIVAFMFGTLRNDRVFRFSCIALMFSLFMAAATTTHNDVYRFRLMFIPFLFYSASRVILLRGSGLLKLVPLNKLKS